MEKIKSIAPKIFKSIVSHKIMSAVIFVLIAGGGYYSYKVIFGSSQTVSYVTAAVEKGTLITSISGSGQVSATNQVDIKPKTSGEIMAVYVVAGQEVKAGALFAAIDATDATRAVRDAETSLETAKLEMDKLLQPADELTLLQSENSLIQARESKQNSEENLKKAREDGFNAVSNVFLNLPSIMSGLYDIMYSTNTGLGGASQWNIDYYAGEAGRHDEQAYQYKADADTKYHEARSAYDRNFQDYKTTSRFSDDATIESLINQTYETIRKIAEATKSDNNLIQFYEDKMIEHNLKPASQANAHLSTLSSYTASTNGYLSSILSARNSIQDSKNAITSAERSIAEKTLSFKKTKSGPDELDIRAKKIAIQQKEDALSAAKQTLADCYIRAPFDGIIAKVSVKKGDSASSGTAAVTIITKQKLAEISLNEVDIAKINSSAGKKQKATLVFDAIDNFSIAGEVVEVDAVGTASQGVVTYNVKIELQTQDDRVKPGMSVSAAIITDIRQNVLMAPNSAIKQQGETSYVEILENGILKQQIVETGLSNDTMTEITSGLAEGQQIVTQTINSSSVSSATTNAQGGSGVRIPGLGGMGR
ncbi:efflux RND transporter periplasmic adaptor subunit [Patescibacteria group bacterium]|nr:efflux RND transporter periplasmic adaptor subunit [Patescibacteria group bacterium]MBU4353347.1 efflux RND transporter periplasmic adaptor subunit [Patescibacteria group bacterium]MBU4477262.1 efflux RND transporter periplasmic adaptor subunit [Patescibacteria group bacterium]MCG2699221.1 efflux RND transporter periplasmic adaptor subunit [Candidatus Parcubacteria bacterium]